MEMRLELRWQVRIDNMADSYFDFVSAALNRGETYLLFFYFVCLNLAVDSECFILSNNMMGKIINIKNVFFASFFFFFCSEVPRCKSRLPPAMFETSWTIWLNSIVWKWIHCPKPRVWGTCSSYFTDAFLHVLLFDWFRDKVHRFCLDKSASSYGIIIFIKKS